MDASKQSLYCLSSSFNTSTRNDERREPLTAMKNGSYNSPDITRERGSSRNSQRFFDNSSPIHLPYENNSSRNSVYIPLNSTEVFDYHRENDNTDIGMISKLRRNFSSIDLTKDQRLVLKCSFAYFLASLFTFIPFFNSLIGNNRISSHLVATATVFFNPAKTLGGMVEAAAFGWGYLIFAVLICLLSMSSTLYFEQVKSWETTAHVFSLFFWLAGSTFIVSYLKAHWNKPAVSTASSLCFITLFIIIVREGSTNQGDFDTIRIRHITTAVATGTLITVACCIVFWPMSACEKLGHDIYKILESNRNLITLVTDRFFLKEFIDNDTCHIDFNISEQHKSQQELLDALHKSFKESKFEGIWNGQVRGRIPEYTALIKSLNQLLQFANSLQISCGFDADSVGYCHNNSMDRHKQWHRRLDSLFSTSKTKANAYKNQSNDTVPQCNDFSRYKDQNDSENDDHSEEDGENAYDFASTSHNESFLNSNLSSSSPLSPAFITFYQQMSPSLKHLISTYLKSMDGLQQSFRSNRDIALHQLERELKQAITACNFSKKQVMEKLNLSENAIRSLGPDFFHVNFFLFNMLELCEELVILIKSTKALNDAEEREADPLNWRSFRDNCIRALLPKKRMIKNTAYNLHTPAPDTAWRRFLKRFWKVTLFFKLRTTRYAMRATIAAVLLAMPAFCSSTGTWFRSLRMEWALVTLMVVLAPTVGGTNIVAIYRIFSTMIGCFVAALFYTLFPANIIVLPLLTWLFSIPNFYLILTNKHGKFGQFTLLAYNLVMLTKYNDHRDEDTTGVWILATQRCVAILVGVVVGLLVTALIYPFEARVELRKGLSDLLLRLAWYYQELVFVFSRHQSLEVSDMVTDLPRHYKHAVSFMQVELDLQSVLVELEVYLSQTPKEFRLKGPFPVSIYRSLLNSNQKIVDRLVAIRMIVSKNSPIKSEALVGNVLLYFYILGSALCLKTPMPPYLPPARLALENIILNDHSQNELDYHYLMLTSDIIDELEKLGNKTTLLFGSLVPEWNTLFHG